MPKVSETQILIDQGWTKIDCDTWQIPTSNKWLSTEKALEIANDSGFKELLVFFGF